MEAITVPSSTKKWLCNFVVRFVEIFYISQNNNPFSIIKYSLCLPITRFVSFYFFFVYVVEKFDKLF